MLLWEKCGGKMLFKTTGILLETVRPYTGNAFTDSFSEQDMRSAHTSDLVVIDAGNHVGFEVFENRVIVFFFTGRRQFSDHFNQNHEYIARAVAFLKDLFEYRLLRIAFYKRERLCCEKYWLLYDDGRKKRHIATVRSRFANPFCSSTTRSATWHFDRAAGVFSNRQPKHPDLRAVEVVDVSDACYIELFCKNNVFSYAVMEMLFDSYSGQYYWAPAGNVLPSGLYDTREKAVAAAREALDCRAKLQ